MAYRERIQVTFADVDMMGHVNNAAYFTYFETARTNYLLHLKGLKAPIPPPDLGFIVARATCDFRRGLRWGERIEVVTWPSRIGETSFDFSYRIIDEAGQSVADGLTVQVAFDYHKGTKVRIEEALRRGLEAELKKGPEPVVPA